MVRPVEVWHRLVVLDLVILHGEAVAGPVRIHGQSRLAPFGVRVAEQPVESILPQASLAEDSAARLQHVGSDTCGG